MRSGKIYFSPHLSIWPLPRAPRTSARTDHPVAGPTIIPNGAKTRLLLLVVDAVLSFLPPSMETPALLIGPVIVLGALLLLPFLSGEGEKSWRAVRLPFSRSCLSPLCSRPLLISRGIPRGARK